MTAFMHSPVVPDSLTDNVSVNSNTANSTDTATKPISADEFRLAADVLQIAELNNNTNVNIFIQQTASAQYKKVSEDLNPEANKVRVRKKSLKDLMQQSFFHGAYWLGSTNFIA